MLGDLNINISANTKTGGSETYLDHLISSGSIPIVTLPTRVTDTSSTLIDHIITNDTTHKIKPGVIRCDNKLSDHYVIYCNVSGYTSPRHNKLHYFFRDKTNFNSESYCEDMTASVNDFASILDDLTEQSFNDAFEPYIQVIHKVIDKHAPLKQMLRKLKKLQSKPWITKSVYESIRLKNIMYKTHYLSNDDAKKREYKIFANKLTKTKALAKKDSMLKSSKIIKKIHVRHRSCFAHCSQDNLRKTAHLLKT